MSRGKRRFVYVKVHTTGFNSRPQQLLQLSAVCGRKRFNRFLYVTVPVEASALKIHGIVRGKNGLLYTLAPGAFDERVHQNDFFDEEEGMVLATDGYFYKWRRQLPALTIGKEDSIFESKIPFLYQQNWSSICMTAWFTSSGKTKQPFWGKSVILHDALLRD